MKRISLIALVFLLLASIEKSFALDVPPPPIDIDISNSEFEIVDSTQFRIRQVLAPGYPGTYWADFLWNPGQLIFQPTNVGKESSASSGKIGVAIVAKSGGRYSDPIAAINDIAAWCGTPSETNPCLIKILPGVYDVGTIRLEMMPYVDIEGSGENVTKIRGRSSNGIIRGTGFTEMRLLTVEQAGGVEEISTAMIGAPSQRLTNVTIISSGGASRNYGILYQMNIIDVPLTPPLRMKNVTVIASGGNESIGVENEFNGGLIIIEHSSITGSTNSIRNFTSTSVAGSQLNGPVATLSGITTCAGVYDQNFVFYTNTCP